MKKTSLKTILILLLISSINLFSNEVEEYSDPLIETVPPEQISDLIENSDLLIGGLVNPLSGNLCLRNQDLTAKGAQDITLNRTFIASYMPKQFDDDGAYDLYYLYDYTRSMKGWVFFPHRRLKLRTIDEKRVILFTFPNGISIDYVVSEHGENSTTSLFDTSALGINNYTQDLPSALHDQRNVKIYGMDRWDRVVVKTPEGKIYHYKATSPYREPLFYLLEKEVLENGKVLRYTHYPLEDAATETRIMHIESCDPLERFVYASMDLYFDPVTRRYRFLTNSGQEAIYNYERRKRSQYSKKKNKEINYSTQSAPFLSEVSTPFYRTEQIQYNSRFLLNKYLGRNNPFSCTYDIFHSENNEHYRVKSISRPVGVNDATEILHDIHYQVAIPKKRGGKTTVKHADDTKTIYTYSNLFLINEIQYFDAKGRLKKAKSFAWNQKHWLTSLTLSDGQGNIFYKKSYIYDNFGNPITETILGNITGEGNTETIINRKFSKDGRNLLLKEEREGEAIYYRYLPNTNLKTAVYTKANKKIFRRIFYLYNDANALIRKIEDDGFTPDRDNLEGVSQRKITKYILRLEQPFVHLPEWIIENYTDKGEERLLKKKKLSYNSFGHVSQEDIFDANEEFVYSLFYEYNERGDLVSETNALGQKALYEYDDRGNRTSATSFSQNTVETMQYDSTGRLRNKTKGNTEVNFSKSFEYNKNNHLVRETDGHDNATFYQYDPFVNKVSEEIRPPIASLDGTQEVKTLTRYDSFGRAIAKTDANGNTTEFKYNLYDSPIEIIYPNGSKELFRYDSRGRLLLHIDREGNETQYTYDPLGRIASKVFAGLTEYFVHNGFNLRHKTNREGRQTHYVYDGAGRLTQERFGDQVIDYVYDPLGRKSKETKHNYDNTLIITYKWDLLDRLIKETESSLDGNILYQINYGYDGEGNRNKITRFVNNLPAKETFAYDPLNRLVEHRDPLDNVTKTEYNDFFINSLKQRVLSKTTIDPEGIRTVAEHDPFGRVVKQEIIDKDKPVSVQKNLYDPHGNIVEHQDLLTKKTLVSRYTYNNLNLVENFTRAYETSHSRTTEYTYTPSGRIASKQLPDSTVLTYAYSPTGKLQTLISSDNQIDHRFEYNKSDILTKAYDAVNQITVDREVDLYGNVIKETLSTGIGVEKSYDLLNRRTALDLGVFGKVLYQHDPSYLREVTRLREQSVYTHRYVQYDLARNLLEEECINKLDTIHYSYDPIGRQIAINSVYFNEEYQFNSQGNLISRSHAQGDIKYGYDSLSQLISESGKVSHTYAYDVLHNRISKNGKTSFHNELNELVVQDEIACSYDLNGNLIKKTSPETTLKFTYDPLNRLIQAEKNNQTIKFSYDPLGRRLTKAISEKNHIVFQEKYFYDGMEEIGAIDADGKLKQFRVLGQAYGNMTFDTVAIELNERSFAVISDRQNNIRILVDSETKKADNFADFTAFGETVSEKATRFNPWRYAAKRCDYELGLINFGKRYYDPELARWLSTDPAGVRDSYNLYQFLLNNPNIYCDPYGEFIFIPIIGIAFGVSAPVLTYSIGQIAMGTAMLAVAAWGGAKAYNLISDIRAEHLINQVHQAAEEIPEDTKRKKPIGTYAPNRPLPKTKDGVPIPDSENPHTQLGTKKSTKTGETYTQGREFDITGTPVRDIHVTDHGYPKNHPNPHQHDLKPNNTGGTLKRGPPEPLEGWNYL